MTSLSKKLARSVASMSSLSVNMNVADAPRNPAVGIPPPNSPNRSSDDELAITERVDVDVHTTGGEGAGKQLKVGEDRIPVKAVTRMSSVPATPRLNASAVRKPPFAAGLVFVRMIVRMLVSASYSTAPGALPKVLELTGAHAEQGRGAACCGRQDAQDAQDG